jgi:hypothetical protein
MHNHSYFIIFLTKVDDTDNECWNWNGRQNKACHFSYKSRLLAHKSQPFWKCSQISNFFVKYILLFLHALSLLVRALKMDCVYLTERHHKCNCCHSFEIDITSLCANISVPCHFGKHKNTKKHQSLKIFNHLFNEYKKL